MEVSATWRWRCLLVMMTQLHSCWIPSIYMMAITQIQLLISYLSSTKQITVTTGINEFEVWSYKSIHCFSVKMIYATEAVGEENVLTLPGCEAYIIVLVPVYWRNGQNLHNKWPLIWKHGMRSVGISTVSNIQYLMLYLWYSFVSLF